MNGTSLESYHAAQEDIAVMDRSDLGRVRMTGEDRIDFLHRMSTNEVRDLRPGIGRRTVLTSDIARIVDVVTVYPFPDHLLLLTSAGGAGGVVGHLQRYIFFRDRVQLTDVTGETGLLTLLGPRSAEVLASLSTADLAGLEVNHFVETTVDGAPTVVARTDALGLTGYHLITGHGAANELYGQLIKAGAWPMDVETYEVLRIEAGEPVYGRELGDEFNPLEAGLKPIISFEKGCYIGQEVVARLDTYDKVRQHLVGVRLERPPRGNERPELRAGGDRVGFLTSWVTSPALGPVALGYVLSRYFEPGMNVVAVDDDGPIPGRIVELPFFS